MSVQRFPYYVQNHVGVALCAAGIRRSCVCAAGLLVEVAFRAVRQTDCEWQPTFTDFSPLDGIPP